MWRDSYVNQTDNDAGQSDSETTKVNAAAAIASAIPRPQVASFPPLVIASKKKHPVIEFNDKAYLLALNRFAMEQVATANAAHAAAAAAMRAAHLHGQLKKEDYSPRPTQSMPSLSYSHFANMPCRLLNHTSFVKEE